MTTTNIDAFAPATAMLAALRRRDVSAVEMLDLHLERIGRFNPSLNAIVTPCFEDARREAEAADRARAAGEDRPLLGLPLTIKDCIDVAGLRGTMGVVDFAERRPESDSPLAARVRAAGGVLIGKTNVPPSPATGRQTILSSAARTIPGTSNARPAAVPAAAPRPWPPG